jgi:hypothetical protein
MRVVEETVDSLGDIWETLQILGREQIRKMAFIVVNAKTKIEAKWDKFLIRGPGVRIAAGAPIKSTC